MRLWSPFKAVMSLSLIRAAEMDRQKVILQKILFGGDNLMEERARNLQGAMADGGSDYDCLNGIIPKNDDWHAIRYMYKVGGLLFEK